MIWVRHSDDNLIEVNSKIDSTQVKYKLNLLGKDKKDTVYVKQLDTTNGNIHR